MAKLGSLFCFSCKVAISHPTQWEFTSPEEIFSVAFAAQVPLFHKHWHKKGKEGETGPGAIKLQFSTAQRRKWLKHGYLLQDFAPSSVYMSLPGQVFQWARRLILAWVNLKLQSLHWACILSDFWKALPEENPWASSLILLQHDWLPRTVSYPVMYEENQTLISSPKLPLCFP